MTTTYTLSCAPARPLALPMVPSHAVPTVQPAFDAPQFANSMVIDGAFTDGAFINSAFADGPLTDGLVDARRRTVKTVTPHPPRGVPR